MERVHQLELSPCIEVSQLTHLAEVLLFLAIVLCALFLSYRPPSRGWLPSGCAD